MGKSTTINSNNITIEQSMGGVVAGNTFISSTLIITPGELQPQLSVTPPNGIGNTQGSSQLITVFPNPTNQIVFIQGNFAKQQSLNCTLTDALGRILIQKVFVFDKGDEHQEINLSAIASGQYNLSLKWTQSNMDFNRVFKIQKIK